MIMLKLRNIQLGFLILFIFVIVSWILVSKVKEYEKEDAVTKISEATSKSKQEIASLESVILSIKSDARLLKVSATDAVHAFEEKEARLVKQVAELQKQLSESEKVNIKKNEDISALQKKHDQMKERGKNLNQSQQHIAKPFSGKKLVHFDLKGAPPKVNYLIKMMKYMKQLGADGFLIEYEDMFPWEGEFSVLKSSNAYSKDDIKNILQTAQDEDLIIIPLIQTFGHLEFLLKHSQFKHLRADKEITNVICPINKDSVPLIKKMLEQVVAMHPKSTLLHLGGDEVYNLKTCEKCKTSNMSEFQLYTNHMLPLFEYIKTKSTANGQSIQPIIWDDMLRKWDVSKLKIISKHVTPMVWGYVADISRYRNFPTDMWDRFAAAFPNLWIASSFKGALKPWSNFVPLQQHLDNHLSWLNLIWKLREKGSNIVGVAITGWSRFDHYGPLCELLPAGIPSLALCLSVLKNGKFDSAVHDDVSKQLGFNKTFALRIPSFKDYIPETGAYPAGEFYNIVGTLEKAIGLYDWSNVRRTGWTRSYVTKTRLLSYFQVNSTLTGLNRSKDLLKGLDVKAADSLSQIFDKSVVDEWVEDKIHHYVTRVDSSINEVMPLLSKAIT